MLTPIPDRPIRAVAHGYVNNEATPIEAVYVFPLDEGAAVCAFEAVVDGTLVVGEVHERDKAFEIYDDAMEAGHGAFLLDEERADVFQASVGNLPPGKEVTVKLTYVTELAVDDGRLRFAIPTTVSPRYAPAEDRVGTGRSDDEALNPPVLPSVPYGLTLSVRVAMPRGITAIESPSHPIALRIDDGCTTVSLAQKDAALDRDFVLSIEAPGLNAPQALAEREEDGTEAIGVAFAPAFATTSAPAELIFLVDAVRAKETGVTVLFQSAPPSPVKPAPAGMHALILLQAADGSWELTQELASIIGRDLGALRSAVKGATGPKPELLRVWATALALAWLGRNAADVEDEWRLLAAKAQRWIDGTAVVPPGGGPWLDEAKGYLG